MPLGHRRGEKMASENDLSGKVGLDTTGFKTGANDLSSQIRQIETGFRASAAIMGNWGETSDGLKLRTESLSDKLTLQKQKLGVLLDEYNKLTSAEERDEKAIEKVANMMFQAEKAISSTEKDLKNYNSQLANLQGESQKSSSDLNSFGNSAEKAEKDVKELHNTSEKLSNGLKSGLSSGLKTATAGVAAMGAAMVAAAAGAIKMISSSVENADELQRLSDVTGRSAEELQKMQYVGSAVGVDLDTMTGAQSKLIKAMNASKNATSAQGKAFAELGVKTTDAKGNLRDSNAVFSEAIGALGKVSNATERDAMAIQIFGKSAMELNPLIKTGSDGIAQLSAEAEANGAIMSNEAVSGLDAFGDSVDALKLSGKGMAGSISALLLPAMSNLVGMAGDLSGALNNAVKTGDFSQLGTVIGDGLTNAVSQFSDLATKFMPIATQILSSLANALVVAIPVILPALAGGIVQIFNSLIDIITQNAPMIINMAIQTVTILLNGLIQMLPQILQMGISLLITLIQGITSALPSLIPAIVGVILEMVNVLTNPDNLSMLITTGINLLFALIDGLLNAIPQLVSAIPMIIKNLTETLIKLLPELIPVAFQIITTLAIGLTNYIPTLLTYVPQIITAIIGAFKTIDWGEIGRNVISGIIEGFKSMLNKVNDACKNVSDSIKNSFKNALGIHSPSTVFEGFGKFMLQGLTDGIDGNLNMVKRSMGGLSKVASSFNGSASMGINGTNGYSSSSQNIYNNYGATQNVKGIGTPKIENTFNFTGKVTQSDVDFVVKQVNKQLGLVL